MFERTKKHLKGIYDKLGGLEGDPQSVAIGFGIGVFLGVLPGTGPVVAVGAAWLLRVNKVAAFAGGMATNSWLSVVTFVLAAKVGAAMMGTRWQDASDKGRELWHHFSWDALFNASTLEILKPLVVGYALVSFACGAAAYLAVLCILTRRRKVA